MSVYETVVGEKILLSLNLVVAGAYDNGSTTGDRRRSGVVQMKKMWARICPFVLLMVSAAFTVVNAGKRCYLRS